jgi:hypothetical protein
MGFFIARGVPGQLGQPIVFIGCDALRSVLTMRAAMPKAAMDEYSPLLRNEHDIGLAGQSCVMKRYRRPARWSALRTRNSGFVSRLRTLAIIRLRVVADTRSTTELVPTEGLLIAMLQDLVGPFNEPARVAAVATRNVHPILALATVRIVPQGR